MTTYVDMDYQRMQRELRQMALNFAMDNFRMNGIGDAPQPDKLIEAAEQYLAFLTAKSQPKKLRNKKKVRK